MKLNLNHLLTNHHKFQDTTAERQVLNKLMYDGFSYDRNYESYILKDEDKIYNFITNCISYYMENYEVLISEEFKKKEIRQPKKYQHQG